MELLVSKIKITKVDHETVLKASKDKRVKDFEDGLEYYAALEVGCKVLITEDTKDFYYSEIEVLDSRSFIRKYFG